MEDDGKAVKTPSDKDERVPGRGHGRVHGDSFFGFATGPMKLLETSEQKTIRRGKKPGESRGQPSVRMREVLQPHKASNAPAGGGRNNKAEERKASLKQASFEQGQAKIAANERLASQAKFGWRTSLRGTGEASNVVAAGGRRSSRR